MDLNYYKNVKFYTDLKMNVDFINSVFKNDDILLEDLKNHTVTAVFDRDAKVVCFTTDGIFCDGGEKRQFGFTRFSSDFTIDSDFKKSDAKIKFAQGLHLCN